MLELLANHDIAYSNKAVVSVAHASRREFDAAGQDAHQGAGRSEQNNAFEAYGFQLIHSSFNCAAAALGCRA
jgi:hypothetical protein